MRTFKFALITMVLGVLVGLAGLGVLWLFFVVVTQYLPMEWL